VKTNYGNKPVNLVSWFDCARYCNWLHNAKPTGSQNSITTEDGAYTLNGEISGDAVPKNAGAKYHIPTGDEWYKAAYYKGGGTNAGYWDYATQSDSLPTCVAANSVGDGVIA
jgi:formylglycine-generating enzyme required for sulfatase activity